MSPAWWGTRPAGLLHDAALEALTLSKHRTATLECRDDNPRAQAFYRRNGWTPGRPLEWAGHMWARPLPVS